MPLRREVLKRAKEEHAAVQVAGAADRAQLEEEDEAALNAILHARVVELEKDRDQLNTENQTEVAHLKDAIQVANDRCTQVEQKTKDNQEHWTAHAKTITKDRNQAKNENTALRTEVDQLKDAIQVATDRCTQVEQNAKEVATERNKAQAELRIATKHYSELEANQRQVWVDVQKWSRESESREHRLTADLELAKRRLDEANADNANLQTGVVKPQQDWDD